MPLPPIAPAPADLPCLHDFSEPLPESNEQLCLRFFCERFPEGGRCNVLRFLLQALKSRPCGVTTVSGTEKGGPNGG